jgi:hypothetical protein
MSDMNDEDQRYINVLRRELEHLGVRESHLLEQLAEASGRVNELRTENILLMRTIAALATRRVREQLEVREQGD